VAAVASVEIPHRAVFRAQEVCDLAQVQPYVLRSWEAEFPDLGVAKTPGAPRLYRRSDVERVLRLKQLLFVDGLTLAGARKQLSAEAAPADDGKVSDADIADVLNAESRERLRELKRGLEWMLQVLSAREGALGQEFELRAQPVETASRAGRQSPTPPAPVATVKGKKK
jgi:DNA-binding transcriptional MerR regulator